MRLRALQKQAREHYKGDASKAWLAMGNSFFRLPNSGAVKMLTTDQTNLDLSVNKLRTELRALMEKGRVYSLGSGELVAWGTRFFYVADEGLCYQHVTRRMRPKGALGAAVLEGRGGVDTPGGEGGRRAREVERQPERHVREDDE